MMSRKEQDYIEDNLGAIFKYIKATQGPGLNKISELTTHILVSNMENACSIDRLKDFGVDAILYIGLRKKEEVLLKKYSRKKIEHYHIEFPDVNETSDSKCMNLVPHLDYTYQIIHKYVIDEKKILVHCSAGLSLSIAVLLYYFLVRYYITNFKINKDRTKDLISTKIYFLPGVVKFIKELRPCIDPHIDYLYQLFMFEYKIKKYFQNILVQESRQNRSSILKNKNKNEDKDENEGPELFPEYSDEEKDIDDYLDEIYSKNKEPEETVETSSKKIKEVYDKLEDLLEINI